MEARTSGAISSNVPARSSSSAHTASGPATSASSDSSFGGSGLPSA
ncbi:hypothetical protein [Catenulispora rubra]|nr:hypothetical protein [Catenulispora rubra]